MTIYKGSAIISGGGGGGASDAADLGGGILPDDVEVGNQNATTGIKFWSGTKAEYDALTPNAETIYYVTDEDDTNLPDTPSPPSSDTEYNLMYDLSDTTWKWAVEDAIHDSDDITFTGTVQFNPGSGETVPYFNGNGLRVGGNSDANQLDDYEQATWTPTTATGDLVSNYARYVKIGDFIQLEADITFPTSSSSSIADIQSLPFEMSRFNIPVGLWAVNYSSDTTQRGSLGAINNNRLAIVQDTTGDRLSYSDLSGVSIHINMYYRTTS